MVNLVYTYIFQNKERWNSLQACKKIFVSLCVAILLFNIVSPVLVTMAASKEYDHEELMQYDGYAKSIYESLVEETTYITGQYTQNKEYVSKSIDQIKDYSSFWWNEQKFDSEPWTYDRFKELIAKPVGYALTVGDWIKNFFGGYKEQHEPDVPNVDTYGPYLESCGRNGNRGYIGWKVKSPYRMYIKSYQDKYYSFSPSHGCITMYAEVYGETSARFKLNDIMYGHKNVDIKNNPTDKSLYNYFYNWTNDSPNFGNIISTAAMVNLSFYFYKVDTDGKLEEVTPSPTLPNPNGFDDFKKYVDEKISQMTMPRPKPYLSCPNGTKIQMSIDGGTFLGVNGKAMIVNKDGTAQVDSAICQLNWDKPTVKYIDDHVVMESPDGKWQDVETGEIIDENAGNTDDTEPTEPEPNNPNPSCELSDEEMEVDSEPCEGVPYFGKKLEYIFGNATGNKHNIDRSIAMERQLNSIGIFDDPFGRKLVLDNLSDAFDNPSSILKTQENGRIVRESLLSGPNGVLKVESVWDREKLITVKLYGGK